MHCNLTSDKEDYVNFRSTEPHTTHACILSFLWNLADLRRFTLTDSFLVAETYASIAIDL
jgi:hypothetical protein